MKFTRTLSSCAIAILTLGGFSVSAQESTKKGLEFLESTGWFKASTPIQELREQSTKSFELLDENDSGSITLDEIDITEMEDDMSKMNPAQLRENRQRIQAIHHKFMNWSEEIDEFDVVDTNNDGYWSEEEFEARSDELNLHRLELGIEQWDEDENGAVELHEFNSHLDELEMYDEDGDGTVSREEAFKSKDGHVISDVLLQQLQLDAIVVGGSEEAIQGFSDGATITKEVRIIHKTNSEESKEN
ncbi:MAG: hypothetical protein F4W92_05835 [Gammaproteobacteria bacterium]|nr:hypothetical protein [Gammaproteobacteria bacterium]